MTKEELIEKLTKLYEKGKDDHNLELYEGVVTNPNDYIIEMAENILKSFQLKDYENKK